MSAQEIEQLAIEIGMSTKSTGYSAPPGIMNPGLYFGAKIAFVKANERIKELERDLYIANLPRYIK
jgi:hypothetical protein